MLSELVPLVFDRKIGKTAQGRSIDWFVNQQVDSRTWHEEEVSTELSGLTRPIKVFRGIRKTNLVTYDWHGDKSTFCPPMWWDLAIGSGACGLGCRSCFLMLTHRVKRDPLRHLLYTNLSDFEKTAEKWLLQNSRRQQHSLGVGIDRSDSLLYEGIAPHARNLSALFGNPKFNPKGNKLVLLTKSTNTHFLEDINPHFRKNIIISFSLNPEPIADLWEGKWPDGIRITRSIGDRLLAAKIAQDLGFEIRVRVDPIIPAVNWQVYYQDFLAEIKNIGLNFRYWTLGTYREKNPQLDAWRERWGLPEMEWQPNDYELAKDGTHRHLPEARRIEIYKSVSRMIRREFPNALISLCKETHAVRKEVSLCNADCNCLI